MAYPNDQAQAGGAIPVWLAAAPSGSTSGTGTNRSGTTTGAAGNSRYMISNDSVHMSVVGNVELARRFWNEVLKALSTMIKF